MMNTVTKVHIVSCLQNKQGFFWNFSYLQDLPQNSAFLPGITRNVLQHTFICHFYLHGPCRVAVMEPLDGRVVYRTRGSASTRIQTVISRTGGSFFLNLKENCVLVVAERRRRRELVAKITENLVLVLFLGLRILLNLTFIVKLCRRFTCF